LTVDHHVLAYFAELFKARRNLSEQVYGFGPSWPLRSGVLVIHDSNLSRLRSAIRAASVIIGRSVVIEDVPWHWDVREQVLGLQFGVTFKVTAN